MPTDGVRGGNEVWNGGGVGVVKPNRLDVRQSLALAVAGMATVVQLIRHGIYCIRKSQCNSNSISVSVWGRVGGIGVCWGEGGVDECVGGMGWTELICIPCGVPMQSGGIPGSLD
eukprot:320179-Chlamydomonas_euryale.AAC.1